MKVLRDIAYGTYGADELLDVYLPETEGTHPLFVYFHGGGMWSGSKNDNAALAETVVKRGIGFVSVNYRKYPTAHYPEFIEDASLAVKWAYDHTSPIGGNGRLYVGGSSAGGYLSMMLAFDEHYLADAGVPQEAVTGYLHDAGQPTVHFNVLRERGLDNRRVIVDEAAPLFHIRENRPYPPMRFIVSTHDMENRYEQTMLTLSTLRHFGYPEDRREVVVMDGTHCAYCRAKDEAGDTILGKLIADFVWFGA